MSNWHTVEFQSLAADAKSAFSKPYGSSIMKADYVSGGVPVVRGINLRDGIFLDDEFVFIPDHLADRMPGANLAPGDLVFTHRGTIGQVSMIPRHPRYTRYVLSTSQVKARLDQDRALPEFYYYWFTSPDGQHELRRNISTVGVPGLGQPVATIKAMKVPYPTLDEQAAIAAILGAIDSKIGINGQVIEVAFKIAEARYRQVVDLASVVLPVKDILELRYGKALPAASRSTGRVPVYGSGGLTGWHNKAIAPGPGIIVGRKGSVGTVFWSAREFFAIDTTFYVTLKRDVPLEFAFFMLRDLPLDVMNSDSAVPGLNRNDALSLSVRIPTESELRNFQTTVNSVFELRDVFAEESAALARMRDVLLPLLMSGAIRVREAERITEEMT